MNRPGAWYRLLAGSAALFGPWLFALVARIIAAGFFLFSASTRESRRFYSILFPDRTGLYPLWCTFRQYQNFTTIHLDRFLVASGHEIAATSDGLEKLEQVITDGGAILLMSHLGNWELAAHLLKQRHPGLQMLLYMGKKEKEGIERMQKEGLRQAGVRIIGVEQDQASPLAAVEGIRLLGNGGLVSMTGDVVWHRDQRTVQVPFLGHGIRLPVAPYVFSLVSGAPILVFFAFRTGRGQYHFTLSDPIHVRPAGRDDREQAIARAAGQYAALLETALRAHPLQWYHFRRFLE